MATTDDEQSELEDLKHRLEREVEEGDFTRASDISLLFRILGIDTEVVRVNAVKNMDPEQKEFALLVRETEFEKLLKLVDLIGGNNV